MDINNILESMKVLGNLAGNGFNKAADIAALKLKTTNANRRVEEAYRNLGEVSFRHFSGDEDLSEEVAKAMEEVEDALVAQAMAKQEYDALKEEISQSQKELTDAVKETVSEVLPEEWKEPGEEAPKPVASGSASGGKATLSAEAEKLSRNHLTEQIAKGKK